MKRIGYRVGYKALAIMIVILVSTMQAFAMEEIKISKTEGCNKIGIGESYGGTYVCTITKDLKDIKILIDSNDITLEGNMKSLIGQKGHVGVSISNTKVSIKNVIIKNFKEIKGFSTGIEINEDDVNIESNTIIDNDEGIIIRSNNNKKIMNNIIKKNKIGIDISGTGNIIKSNNIIENSEYGIVPRKNNNRIYNNYLYNINNIKIDNIVNFWNIENDKLIDGTNIIGGKKIGGNFWGKPAGDGYSQTCKDEDNNGICDKQYKINQNNIDKFPLKLVQNSKICIGNAQIGQKVTVAPLPNMRVYFLKLTECGNVVAAKISGKWNVKGYKPKEFYDITFYNVNGVPKSPNAIIYIGYVTIKPEDEHLSIYHLENNKWVQKTNRCPEPKPKDLPSYPLTGYQTVIVGDSSLSPFAIVEIDKEMGKEEGGEGGGGKGIKKCTVCHGISEDCTTSCHSLYESETNFSTSGKSFNMSGFIILTISLLVISILILIRRKDKI